MPEPSTTEAEREVQHTPGEWEWTPTGRIQTVENRDGIAVIARPSVSSSLEHEANARLIAAACTSYDKHCGERAVECAEGDLLGELLEACKAAFGHATEDPQARLDQPQLSQLSAAIAKATGETTT